MRISDWSSDVCSSDLLARVFYQVDAAYQRVAARHIGQIPANVLAGRTHADKFTVKPVMVLQMVEQTSPKFAVCRRRKMRTGFQEMGNFTEDPGPSLSRATNHDSIDIGRAQV